MTDLASAMRAAAAVRVVEGCGMAVPRTEAPLSLKLLRSPAFRCLTKSAHLALARIVIELANGRNAVTHRQFVCYGIARDSITAAVAELEALGIIVVERHNAHANAFDISQKWCGIATIAQAKAVRDRARHFEMTRRRKVERAMARRARQRLAAADDDRRTAGTGTFRCAR